MEHKVLTFFYGSYMNFDVLGEVDLKPSEWETAILHQYDITIQPRANVVKSERDNVYGIVAPVSNDELKRLYAHAEDVLGEVYIPEAVLVSKLDGSYIPALCYISHDMRAQNPDNDYVERIVKPAKEFGFPDWYITRLESFKI